MCATPGVTKCIKCQCELDKCRFYLNSIGPMCSKCANISTSPLKFDTSVVYSICSAYAKGLKDRELGVNRNIYLEGSQEYVAYMLGLEGNPYA